MFAKRTNWNLAPNRLSQALAAHRAAGKPLLDLTVSNPTECGFTYDGDEILQALSNPAALTYETNPRGLPSARRAVADYYTARNDVVSIEDIFLTTSTSEAYSYIFRMLCDPGDEILIPTPSYPLFDFLADLQDVRLVRYPLLYDHGWQIDFHSLEKAITSRTRGVIVVNPNNPTGNFVKRAEIAQLNTLCAAHGMAIIADEVFLDYSLGKHVGISIGAEGKNHLTAEHGSARTNLPPNQPPSFATNAGALTFTMSGLSKISGLPQMKAAWLVVGGPQAQKTDALARLEVIADTYLSMNAPVQLAIPAFLEQRHTFQLQLRTRIQENLAELDRQLSAQASCTRLEVEGGWYAILRVPATQSDEDLAIHLLTQKGVYVHPGHFYDFPWDSSLVLSLITSSEGFAEGLQRLFSTQPL